MRRMMNRIRPLSFAACFAAATMSLFAGCPDREVSEVLPGQDKVEAKRIPFNLNRKVDIIFMVDNSGSMKEEQESLKANFGKFIDVLRSIDGGLPDVHIGVITSDLGSNGGPASGGCRSKGDEGIFRTGGVTFTGGVNFLVDEQTPGQPGMRTTNYPGGSAALASTFATMASVGTGGCGFEQQINSVIASLKSQANNGFLRPDAFLAIVFVTDEDDCSMNTGGALMDPNTAVLGPLDSFRCFEYGVKCDGVDNPRNPGLRQGCVARENSMQMPSIASLVQQVKAIKGADADKKIIVASINGPSTPVSVGRNAMNQPKLDPACTYNGPSMVQTASPGVRMSSFISSFRNNSETTICKEDLSDALQGIAGLLKAVIGTPCFDAKLKEPVNCIVSDVTNFGEPNETEKLMPQCPGAMPCWEIKTDTTRCPAPATGKVIVFNRGGSSPGPNTVTTVSCETSD